MSLGHGNKQTKGGGAGRYPCSWSRRDPESHPPLLVGGPLLYHHQSQPRTLKRPKVIDQNALRLRGTHHRPQVAQAAPKTLPSGHHESSSKELLRSATTCLQGSKPTPPMGPFPFGLVLKGWFPSTTARGPPKRCLKKDDTIFNQTSDGFPWGKQKQKHTHTHHTHTHPCAHTHTHTRAHTHTHFTVDSANIDNSGRAGTAHWRSGLYQPKAAHV